MYLFKYPDYETSARQYGEQYRAYRLLYKELDNKYEKGALTCSQWINEHIILDNMKKDIEKEYKYVDSWMNAIVFTTEHPEGEHDKRIIKAFLETAYPDENPYDFCIMQ